MSVMRLSLVKGTSRLLLPKPRPVHRVRFARTRYKSFLDVSGAASRYLFKVKPDGGSAHYGYVTALPGEPPLTGPVGIPNCWYWIVDRQEIEVSPVPMGHIQVEIVTYRMLWPLFLLARKLGLIEP